MSEANPSTWTSQAKIPSVRGAGKHILDDLLGALRRGQWAEADIFGIHLAVEEAIVNAIRHGNDSDHKKQVHVACTLNHQRLTVEIVDEGDGFDPELVPDCTAPENLQIPGGRGLLLMRNYMSKVEFLDGGHRVVMEKSRGDSR
jgi:serine/threonine-protein kinase RsbW